MHNVDKAITKLQDVLTIKRDIEVYQYAIKQLESEVKHDVFTKEQSLLKTRLKFYKNQVKKLNIKAESFK